MTDREILELAAKAAGIDAQWHCAPEEVEHCADSLASTEGLWLKGDRSPDNSKYWNPLNDDGDALRLAVRLGIIIDLRYIDPMMSKYNCVNYFSTRSNGEQYKRIEFDLHTDPLAATRRAIVRAAAEIGKAMQSKED